MHLGKQKRKNKNEYEYLRGEIRDLQKENKRLRQQLKQFDKSKHIYHDVISDYEEMLSQHVEIEPVESKKKTNCSECHQGIMEEFEIMDKIIGTCNNCGFRKRIK